MRKVLDKIKSYDKEYGFLIGQLLITCILICGIYLENNIDKEMPTRIVYCIKNYFLFCFLKDGFIKDVVILKVYITLAAGFILLLVFYIEYYRNKKFDVVPERFGIRIRDVFFLLLYQINTGLYLIIIAMSWVIDPTNNNLDDTIIYVLFVGGVFISTAILFRIANKSLKNTIKYFSCWLLLLYLIGLLDQEDTNFFSFILSLFSILFSYMMVQNIENIYLYLCRIGIKTKFMDWLTCNNRLTEHEIKGRLILMSIIICLFIVLAYFVLLISPKIKLFTWLYLFLGGSVDFEVERLIFAGIDRIVILMIILLILDHNFKGIKFIKKVFSYDSIVEK